MIKNGRKVNFKPVHQTFIELVETTANVDHILGVVQRKWGTNFILVTQDGLKLEDAPGTQGICHTCIVIATIANCIHCFKCIDKHACIPNYRASILEKST